jgi:HlyD family secretion protein
MKNKWLWIGLGAVVLATLVTIGILKSKHSKVTPVQFARVREEEITARVRAPGKIEPKTQVKVSADVMGKIVALPVKEGDHVRRGQLMLQLDDTQYRAALGQARAALASAKARVKEAEAGFRVVDSNYGRQKSLYDQKLLSAAEWDQATNTHESAAATLATSREEVARTQAMVDAATDNVRKCHFVAPLDGVVSALNVEAGEIVITGTMNNPGTEILTVSDLSGMLVRADVDETDVVDLRLGQKAKISVDAMPDTTFTGSVVEIGNTAKRSITSTVEGQTNFEVKVVFDTEVPEVRPGMTADIDVATSTHDKTLGVPIQAVVVRTERELKAPGPKQKQKRPKSGDAFAALDDTVGRKEKEITGLFRVTNGIAQFVPVRTGIASETDIEVFGDVHAGDLVVAGPYKALRELKPASKVRQETPGRGKK